MSLGTIRTLLLADTQITDVVGDKIFVSYADKEVEEAFILIEDGFQTPNDCKGEGSSRDDYTFYVSAVSEKYGTVDTLLKRCRELLDLYSDSYFREIRFSGLDPQYDGTQGYFIKTNSYQSLITI